MSKFKIGDRVLVKNNSHYGSKPRRIVGVDKHLFKPNVSIYYLYGVRQPWDKTQYMGWLEEELVAEEVWNSPLYKALDEKK